MKIVTWNVNGLRAVHKKNFLAWFSDEDADLVCLQETKVTPEQLKGDELFLHPYQYSSAWNSAQKPGYSGTLIYSKKEPLSVQKGLGIDEFDVEGRWLEVEFQSGRQNWIVICTYFPNSQRDHARLDYKLAFCQAAEKRLQELRNQQKRVMICGDFNIAHKEIDLKNPKTNVNNAGFLPQERAWLDRLTGLGWIDGFRKFEKGADHYTWWSYRPGVREKNIGWRLDYFFINPEVQDEVQRVIHRPEVFGSDHCPVVLELKD